MKSQNRRRTTASEVSIVFRRFQIMTYRSPRRSLADFHSTVGRGEAKRLKALHKAHTAAAKRDAKVEKSEKRTKAAGFTCLPWLQRERRLSLPGSAPPSKEAPTDKIQQTQTAPLEPVATSVAASVAASAASARSPLSAGNAHVGLETAAALAFPSREAHAACVGIAAAACRNILEQFLGSGRQVK